jgi:hypothetical protein
MGDVLMEVEGVNVQSTNFLSVMKMLTVSEVSLGFLRDKKKAALRFKKARRDSKHKVVFDVRKHSGQIHEQLKVLTALQGEEHGGKMGHRSRSLVPAVTSPRAMSIDGMMRSPMGSPIRSPSMSLGSPSNMGGMQGTPPRMKRRKKSSLAPGQNRSPMSARAGAGASVQIVICHLTVHGDKGMGLVFDHSGAPPNQKIWIDEIIADTPASESEARVGDTLVEVNGTNVQNLEIMRVMKLMTAQHLSLTFLRDPKRLGVRQKQSEGKIMYDVRRSSRSPRGRVGSAMQYPTSSDANFVRGRGQSLRPVVENQNYSMPTSQIHQAENQTPASVLAAMNALASRRKESTLLFESQPLINPPLFNLGERFAHTTRRCP